MYVWNDELGYYEFESPTNDENERNATASHKSAWVRQCLDICDESPAELAGAVC